MSEWRPRGDYERAEAQEVEVQALLFEVLDGWLHSLRHRRLMGQQARTH